MCPGLSDDFQQINDTRKTAIIDCELARLNIDIAALQETRLASNGSLKEKNFTFFWQGLEPEQRRLHGVGFAIQNRLLSSLEPPSEGTERIISLRLATTTDFVNILCVYSPTLNASPEVKDTFYEQLESKIKSIPSNENIVLLGDFNARIGSDHNSWPRCIGHFGVGRINENGQRLLELCSYYDLAITNTFFPTKPQHRVSWRHPRSKHWHQLDLIITRRDLLNNVLVTRTYHSPDCDTDHSLVCCKIRIRTKPIHRSRHSKRPKINISNTSIPELRNQFAHAIDEALTDCPSESATTRWNFIREQIYENALTTFGRNTKSNKDWFEAGINEMRPVLDAKRLAYTKHKDRPNKKTLAAYRAARNSCQKTARKCANDYWRNLCRDIQSAADCGNIRGMYDSMKKAFGPSIIKTAPLKSATGETITDRNKQMERWAEHYQELYSRDSAVSTEAIEKTNPLPIMEELDSPPTENELKEAINSLSCGKAPGMDGIPPEVVKAAAESSLLHHLHSLLLQCWEEGTIPQDMRNAKIITLYKNKGARSDCNNYRGISLLSIVGKTFARVLLKRLQLLAERVYPESQCGFRAARSTIDMVFSIRQLQEKCREQRRPLFLAFIDLTKAFDLVSRAGLFTLLHRIGCPPKLLKLIISFHEDMTGMVQYDGATSPSFPIKNGVKQGCVLAPTLFGVLFSMLLQYAFKDSEDGVFLHTRSDGNLFNLSRFRAKTKVHKVLIREMLFADDAALAAHSEEELQRLMTQFAGASNEFGLTISLKKTNIMGQDVSSTPHISLDDHTFEVVNNFTYLGSVISSNLSLDAELDTRIGKASSSMNRLSKRVWENPMLTKATKMIVYQACVLSTLLYGSESWTLYSKQEARLNAFHMRCLRRLLGIAWQDRVTNEEVLSRAKVPSLYTTLAQKRLRWLGHVCRMQDGRIPKDILYGELATGKRSVGRPMLRFKDVCKRDLKACNVDPVDLQSLAADRSSWRCTVKAGLSNLEARKQSQHHDRRLRRRERINSAPTQTATISAFTCSLCSRACASRIGLFSHKRSCTDKT